MRHETMRHETERNEKPQVETSDTPLQNPAEQPSTPQPSTTPYGCGCATRKAWLNDRWPGLGDAVARVAEPIAVVGANVVGALLGYYAMGLVLAWLAR